MLLLIAGTLSSHRGRKKGGTENRKLGVSAQGAEFEFFEIKCSGGGPCGLLYNSVNILYKVCPLL